MAGSADVFQAIRRSAYPLTGSPHDYDRLMETISEARVAPGRTARYLPLCGVGASSRGDIGTTRTAAAACGVWTADVHHDPGTGARGYRYKPYNPTLSHGIPASR